MKKFILLSFLCSLFSLMSFAQSYPVGYCKPMSAMSVGEAESLKTYELGGAIQLDTKKLASLVGGKITAIKIYVSGGTEKGPVKTSKDLKVFIRKTLEGDDIYTQKVDTFTRPTGWLEVNLDTPYDIDGSEIFVGYSLTANGLPLGFDGNAAGADKRASWISIDGKWQSYGVCGNLTINAMVTSDKFVKRKVLLEHFTTGACNNCPPMHTVLENVLGQNENVVWTAHHSGYGSDVFTLNETEKYMTYFFNGDNYAPAIMFDRTNLAQYGAATIKFENGQSNPIPATGPVFAPGNKNIVETFLAERLSVPAIATVEISESFNPETRELTTTVSGKTVAPELLSNNVYLNVFLNEDGLIAPQSGASSNYVHNHVTRNVVSNVWGDAITFDENGNYSKTYTKVMKDIWTPSNMNIIAFLSNYDSKDPNNCEIYNVASLALKLDPNNINSTSDEVSASIYSNHSFILIDGEFTSANIYNSTGKLINTLNNHQKSCSVDNGIYLVKVTKDNHSIVKKVVVND